MPPRSVLVPSIALMYPDGVYAAGQKRSLSVVVVTDRNARELRSAEVGLFYDDARVVTEGVKAGVWIVIDRKSLRNASGREATIDLERVPWPTSGFSAEAKGSTR
ncbi:MAG TPA: hypothetical protein VKA15_19660 [Isosphaeraceae bacterium]|nr:hypothetical protein [Isosphaeraceae bacterium]